MHQYQVAIFGVYGSEAQRFQSRLEARWLELELDRQLLAFLTGNAIAERDKGRSPAVGIYFGLRRDPQNSDSTLDEFIADGNVVIPVVTDITDFRSFIPTGLHSINGHEPRADDTDFDELCGAVLENLSLLRRSRRIFISYKRAESSGIAIQLYETLDRRTFDVFLDTLAIRPGEPFQEVLWHRLADTDVMVLLDSPGFMASRWTEEELARANSTNLQVLQVVWPDHEQAANAAFSVTHELVMDDFKDSSVVLGDEARLTDGVVDAIALHAEALRARALAARQAHLVREMFREAQALGLTITAQPGRYLELVYPNGDKSIIVPTVGVPDALRYQEIEEDIANEPATEVVLAFDERGIRDRWLKHLTWLDPRMRVRSLRISEVRQWMKRKLPT